MLMAVIGILSMQGALLSWAVLCVILRKELAKRDVWIWFVLVLIMEAVAMGILALWPHLPNAYAGVLPFFVVNSIMLSRSAHIRWVTVVPVLIILNAIARFAGGLFGLVIRWILTPNLTIYSRAFFSKQSNLASQINLLGALFLAYLTFIPLAFWMGHLNNRYQFTSRLRRLPVDGMDYTLVVTYFSVYFFALQVVMQEKLQLQTNFTLFLAIILGVFYYSLLLSRFDQLTNNQLIDNLRGYDATVGRMNEEMHRFSHDYQNVLLSLSYFIKQSDDTELKTYFDQVVHDNENRLSVMGTGDIERLRYVTSGYIKGLLYAKALKAEKESIHFAILINEEIQLREERSVDFVRILGNVLDNALEAANDSNRIVTVSAAPDENVNVFEVKNQIPKDEKFNINKASYSGISTKDGHLGLGLSNIRRLAKQGIEVVQMIDDQNFITTIRVPKAK